MMGENWRKILVADRHIAINYEYRETVRLWLAFYLPISLSHHSVQSHGFQSRSETPHEAPTLRAKLLKM